MKRMTREIVYSLGLGVIIIVIFALGFTFGKLIAEVIIKSFLQ